MNAQFLGRIVGRLIQAVVVIFLMIAVLYGTAVMAGIWVRVFLDVAGLR